MSEHLNIGIIGLGVGESHIAGYQSHPACRVLTLCDLSQESIEALRPRYPTASFTRDARELLEDERINVVSIASYDNFHAEQVIHALERNKHVFVEKPLCLSRAEALQIRDAHRHHPHLLLSSNLVLRASPRFLRLKRLIVEEAFGEIYYIEGDYNYGRLHKVTDGWRGDLDFYSVVYGGGVHLVDLMLWLTGKRVREVTAFGNDICSRGTSFRHNDMVASLLHFADGQLGKMAVNFGCVFPHFHPLNVYGTRMTFLNARPHGALYSSADPSIPPETVTEAYPGMSKGALIPQFIDAILNATSPPVMTEEIFESMAVCFAIEEAVKSREKVVVEYL